MGSGWSDENGCIEYWKAARPEIYEGSIKLFCQRWFLDNFGWSVGRNRSQPTGWGYSDPYRSDMPYIPEYDSIDDVAYKFFGGRNDRGKSACFYSANHYFGMEAFREQVVYDDYCWSTEVNDDGDCGGFFENIGCGFESVTGKFGDFISRTIPGMLGNFLDGMGVGTEMVSWLLSNWTLVLGVILAVFGIGFIVWVIGTLK